MIRKHGEPLEETSTKYLWQTVILQAEAAVMAVVQLGEWMALNSPPSSDRRDGRDVARLFTECGRWERGSGTSWNMRGSGQCRNTASAQGGWIMPALGHFTHQAGEALRNPVWPQSWACSGQWLWLDTSADNHLPSLNCPVMLSMICTQCMDTWIVEHSQTIIVNDQSSDSYEGWCHLLW